MPESAIEFPLCPAPGSTPDVVQQARALACQWQFPYQAIFDEVAQNYPLALVYGLQGLSLQQFGNNAAGPLAVQFVSGKQAWRRQHGGGKGQLVARALGLHKGARPEVFDATAGLGNDAFVLAGLGCQVLMVERSPVVAALLSDGLLRLAQSANPALQEIASRMSLIAPASAQSVLAGEGQLRPEVIYLDPMFPGAGRSAAVKKEMQVFRQLLEPADDEADLLAAAMEHAQYRVVVKRHRQAPAIDGSPPSYSLEGKSTRYDIYSLKKYY